MSTINFSENHDFQAQMASYLAEIREKSNPDDRAKIDACTNITNKFEHDKKVAPNPEIRIQNSEFRIIDQLINQNVNKACSLVETTVIQQAKRVGNHSAQQFQLHGNGICTSMDLSRDAYPSPDQDFNGCLDGNVSENENEQAKILKEIKEAAKQHATENSSTLYDKANDGDMNKLPNMKKKPASNAEQVPGSPENSKMKNRGKNGTRDNIPHINLKKNEFWADPQIEKTIVPTIVKDPNTGRQ